LNLKPLFALAYTALNQLEQMEMGQTTDTVMTVKEVGDYLRVNQRPAVERKMPEFKVGGATWQFKRADVNGRIAAQAARPDSDASAKGRRAQ